MLPTAVFISGGGTTLRNLIALQRAGQLPIELRLVISSNPAAGGLTFAREAGIETLVVEQKRYAGQPEEYCRAMFEPCRAAGVALVVMGGFLKHVQIPDDFTERVINIHPSLIPCFCGAGMYGRRVHAAALDYGVKVSGCTVHFVDNEYDSGPIILQRTCPVEDDDTPETLAARVFEQECRALPEAIRKFAAGDLLVEGRRVLCRSGGNRAAT
ncbi:phosphoribosylglycinamide formyltransferase [Candidatus Laterigemmans baculatus]|uniref:phosphoribosylglycinamide formyltransferase n=1 Tax=Candidatus Laterigemmans baculatus TaxID=2770505 RepID=UPI0013DBF54C|nr:phosphoribosylglycinamide formyltransferase [Candidatus Laterigemmans baculatus]